MEKKKCCGGKSKYKKMFPEIVDTMEKYGKVPGGIVNIFQRAQDLYGCISEDMVNYISKETKISQSKIYEIGKSYSQFTMNEIGENLIMLCKGRACTKKGADKVEKAIEKYLGIKDGETTEDGKFTLKSVPCLGRCSIAPVMVVSNNGKEKDFGYLSKDSVKEVIDNIK